MGNRNSSTTTAEQPICKSRGEPRLVGQNNINKLLPSGETLLLAAIQSGLTQSIHALINAGADVNICDRHGDSPLSSAIRYGTIDIITTLLGHPDINVNLADKFGLTPLHVACIKKRTDVAKMLLENGAQSIPQTTGYNEYKPSPPFLLSLEARDYETAEMLLRMNTSPDVKDSKGDTPLIKAVYTNNIEAVKLLTKYKADFSMKNKWNHSALYYALVHNYCDMVNLLLQESLDRNGYDASSLGAVQMHERPLCLAIKNNCMQCFMKLIRAGENPFIEVNGISPMLCALVSANTWRNGLDFHRLTFNPPYVISALRLETMVQHLISIGADLDLVWKKAVWSTTSVDISQGSMPAHVLCIRAYSFSKFVPVVEQQTAYFRALARNSADEAVILYCYAHYMPSKEDVTIVEHRGNASARPRRTGPGAQRTSDEEKENTVQVMSLLDHFRKNPRTLENISTIAARKAIGGNILHRVSHLSLPIRLSNLITLQDVSTL